MYRVILRFATLVLAIGATASTVYAQEPVNQVVERDPCAGYEWMTISGVTSYNLVVMELPEDADPFPVIDVELPPAATSWTPTLDSCLEPDRDYLWSVRGITIDGDGDWQPSVVFTTVAGHLADASPGTPADEPAYEAEPAQSSSGRAPISPGSIRTVPKPGGLPPSGLRQLGETEKNEPVTTTRQIGPGLATRKLSPSAMEAIQRRRLETTPPKIGYETEAEAQAATNRREREQGQAELARQQNELERKRREEAEAATAQQQSQESTSKEAIGWYLSSSDVVQTPISGEPGDIIRTADLNDNVLSGIDIFEPSNVPCDVQLYGADGEFAKRVNECSVGLPIVDASIINKAKIEPAAIEAVQVCSSMMRNGRVKGLKVSGHIVQSDGSLGLYHQAQGDGPNCANRWQGIVACPSNYVATGVVLHFKDRDFSESLTGLGLICRKIEKIYK